MEGNRSKRANPWAIASLAGLLACIASASADGILCQAHKTVGLLESRNAPFYQAGDGDIRVVEGVAYICTGRDGMFIVDVSNPRNPRLLHNGDGLGQVEYIDVEEGMLYATTWDGALHTIDVSEPQSPHLLASIPSADNFGAIDVVGDLLYVARQGSGLTVFDISNPASPVLLGAATGDFLMTDLQAVGEYVYGIDTRGYLDIFHVANPETPFLSSRRSVAQHTTGLDVVGNVAYIGVAEGALITMDVSDPASPTLVQRFGGAPCEDVVVVSGRAYLPGPLLTVVDVTNPEALAVLGSIELIGSDGLAVEVEDGLAFVLDAQYGLAILDVSGSLEPAEITHAAGNLYAADLDMDASFAVARGVGLMVYDVSDPLAPQFLRRYTYEFGVYDRFRLSGRTMYNATEGLLRVYELTDAGVPELRGQVPVPGSPGRMDVADHLVFVACGSTGLSIVDANDPANPLLTGSFAGSGSIVDLRVVGDLAFVVDSSLGVLVLDVSDPSTPILIGNFADDQARGIDVQGHVGCIARREDGLTVLDFSDPTQPVALGAFNCPMTLTTVRINGAYAFVGNGSNRNFQILDISHPSDPRRVAWMTGSQALPIRVGELLYYSDANFTVAQFGDCPLCAADLNNDGVLDVMDVQMFLSFYAAGDDRADFIDDDRLEFFDVQAFLNQYSAGCP